MIKFGAKKFFWFLAALALLIFLHFTKILIPLESFITAKSRPIFSRLYSASSFLRSGYNKNKGDKDWAAVADELQRKVNDLTAKNAGLKMLEEENRILREHLNFTGKTGSTVILGNIIFSDGLAAGQSGLVTIDKGAKDGLREGLAILSDQGVVVGKIIAVKENLSEACLVNNQNCAFAAAVLNEDKTKGIAEGELGLTVKMKFIPQIEIIKEGDFIVTSGLEKDVPRGLLIGKISRVNKESNELWQNAVIEPMVDFGDLMMVSAIIP